MNLVGALRLPMPRCLRQAGTEATGRWLQRRRGGLVPPRRRSFADGVFAFVATCAWALASGSAFAQTPPGTVVGNEASVYYLGLNGTNQIAVSNRVETVTVVQRTPATINLTRIVPANGAFSEPVGPAFCAPAGDALAPLPDPVLIGNQPVDPAQDQTLVDAGTFHAGEPVFVRIEDGDQNLDPLVAERVEVAASSDSTGDSEIITLTETGPDTGVFAGYIPTRQSSATVDNCILELAVDSELELNYVDAADANDRVTGTALVDPLGRVFDSRTGEPVDGAVVSLIDTATGLPADVLGDDGVNRFPGTVTSGGTATDAGGTLYTFPPGGFRFPLVTPGRYRLQVQAPPGYFAPSSRTVAELGSLPNGPFVISPGSFGNEFIVSPGPVVVVDIPVDPFDGVLFLQKTSRTPVASVGDFVEYALTLTNSGAAGPANGVTVRDVLPPGFRYVAGSARIDGANGPDPSIAADGRNLEFDVGDVAAGTTLSLVYVVAITPGASEGDAINRAIAEAGPGNSSNEASATIQVVEDLFRSKSIIVGRVVAGECGADPAADVDGLANVRIYLEDGRYAVTDAEGRFHFEGIEPGNHVVQLDGDSLPVGYRLEPCARGGKFAGRPFSQFVDVAPGTLWRADFHVVRGPPPTGQIAVELAQAVVDTTLEFELSLTGTGPAVTELTAMVMLPKGVSFREDSARLVGGRFLKPAISGDVLSFKLGEREGEWSNRIRFAADVDAKAGGALVTKAVGRFLSGGEPGQTPTAETRAFRQAGRSVVERRVLSLNFATLSAELDVEDRNQLDKLVERWKGILDITLRATGHSDAVPIKPENRHLFADNYALSRARAAAVARYLGSGLALSDHQISYRGLGADQPVGDNETASGRRENRRVEVEITGLRRDRDPKLKTVSASSGSQVHQFQGRHEDEPRAPAPAVPPPDETNVAAAVNDQMKIDIEDLEPGNAFLSPARDYAPPIPSIAVAVQHEPTATAELLLNNKPVSSLSFEGTQLSSDGKVALSRWRGLDLEDGPNSLEVRLESANSEAVVLSREIHFAGPPVRGRLLADQSSLSADGRSRPVLAVQFFDRWGLPARRGTVGNFRVEPPYRSWWEVQTLKENQLVFTGDRAPTYRVGDNGVAFVELEPTTQAGQVNVHFQYSNEREQEIDTWLKPEARDWILVGLAEGTVGYNQLSKNMELAEESGFDEDYYDDGRVAFFAKGRVKGEFLLTLSYDTNRSKTNLDDGLVGVIDPERFYTLYGDGTEQRFEAPSQRNLYVKLERSAFVALFGDYETGLTVTELGRYSRALNGIKSEFHGDRLSYSAFAAETNQSFARDELLGDGTSGPYRLTRSPIIVNSDTVTIETRDRFRSELILSERILRRFLDYDIDYLSGTLFFKEPIRSRDTDFNPIYIVVDYETRDGRDESLVFGGRGALHFADDRVEVGATGISEEVPAGDSELMGVDLRVDVTATTQLNAELAQSQIDQAAGPAVEGDAYLVELTHRAGAIDGRAYVREQESGFGVGQQRVSEGGTRKTGVDVRAEFAKDWWLEGELLQQENLDTGGERELAEAELRFQNENRVLAAGLRHVADEIPGQEPLESDQIISTASWKMWGGRLTPRLSLEAPISNRNDSVDYPTRSLVGLDLALNQRITFFTEHEMADGGQLDSQMTRIGLRANPWDRTQVNTTFSQEQTEFGPRTFAALGLVHAWQVTERWAIDFGLDQSNTLREVGLRPFDANVPLASGTLTDDFVAAFVGALYRSEFWTFTTRLERRDSDTEDRTNFNLGFYRERVQGRGFSAQLQGLHSQGLAGQELLGADLSLGWAHRPSGNRWTFLNRTDWIFERRQEALLDLKSTRFVNNSNINWLPTRSSQIAFQYAAKYVRSNFVEFSATGYLDLWGAEWRYDFPGRFDVGLQGAWYRSPKFGIEEVSAGVDLGVTLGTNLWLSIGYNFDGFQDDDFSRARYTAQGPFLRLRMKVDQASLKDLLRR